MVGKNLSHYKILDKLGEGGMGIVYLAEDTNLGRQVAIKSLPPQIAHNSDERKRFEMEARAAAALNHPNIATIYSIEHIDNDVYIVMEYIEGKELKHIIEETQGSRPKANEGLPIANSQWLTATGQLPTAYCLDIATQIASGLQAAHDKGITHRDIKSSNIMITPDNQVKIMDFGLAKVQGSADITKENSTLGTTAYMSPEQAEGNAIDHRTDIWSFGVVFYEMLTGQRPFKGDYDQAVIYSILNEDPIHLADFRSDIPNDLEQIQKKCLAKDLNDRYQSANEILADFQQVKTGITFNGSSINTGSVNKKKRNAVLPWILLAIVIMVVSGIYLFAPGDGTGESERKMLVVLPFENLGPEEAEYFADGMTEEITSRLAAIKSLGVISRKSALHYKDSDKTVKEISEELGVDYILEGTVRWARSTDGSERVRITPQLIRAEDDIHLWAENYERIIKDIFRVQSEIAQNVAQQMGVTLLEEEREKIEIVPTDNMDAYHAFLRGRYFINTPHFTPENWQKGIDNFQRAIEQDSGFALAYSELSKAHARLHFLRFDLSGERLEMAEKAAIKAIEYAGDSPEVHLNVGHYYLWAQRDPVRALEEFNIAEKGMPNNIDLLKAKSRLYMTSGRWTELIRTLEKAAELNPNDPWAITELSFAYWWGHEYKKGMDACNRAMEIAPESVWPYLYKANIIWLTTGPNKESREVMKPVSQDHSFWLWSWYWQEVGEAKYQQALDLLKKTEDAWMKNKLYARPKPLLAAWIYEFLNNEDLARSSYDSARVLLEEQLPDYPNDPRYYSSLGVVYAALGKREDAIKHGKKAVELLPVAKDAVYGICYAVDMAVIYTKLGDFDVAMDQIEYLLSIPSFISPAWLKMDIRFSPLFSNPRFQELLKKYRPDYSE